MPWQECDQVSLRIEFVTLATSEGANLSALCRRFGISRKTGYKWLGRYRDGGEAALADRPRRPKRMRRPTPEPVQRRVLALRQQHPAWGGRKIRRRLRNLGQDAPAPSTITKILHRHGLIDPTASAHAKPWQRFQRSEPNELWQMDFKGERRTDDGRWCYPLTMLDDCSRYNLTLSACLNQRTNTVRNRLINVFTRYGLPHAMLMDNGAPWSNGRRAGGWSKLTVWLLRHDVQVIHGRPYHPQTQGKEERFHRTLNVEVLQGRRYRDHTQMQKDFDDWRHVYNHQRPHEALDLDTPASRYRPSLRSFHPDLPSIQYDTTDVVRKVHVTGQINFHRRVYKLSQAFAGQPVALRPTCEEGRWQVYYCRQRIAWLDERTGQITTRLANGQEVPSGHKQDNPPPSG